MLELSRKVNGGRKMLISYKCSNFGGFKNEIEFSMKPGKVTARFKDNVHIQDGYKVSKIAVIVGENAGGKTNFIRSLDFFRYLISDGNDVSTIKTLCNKYNTENSQKFEIEVLLDGIIYIYKLIIDKYCVLSEKLEYRKARSRNTDNKLIFLSKRESCEEVEVDSFEVQMRNILGDDILEEETKKIVEETSQKTGNRQLMLGYFNAIGVEAVKPFRDYMVNDLVISMKADANYNIYKKMEKNERDLEIIKTKEFLKIFKLVDRSIERIEVNEEDPFDKTMIVRKTRKQDCSECVEKGKCKKCGDEFKIMLVNDSSGVREFFAWAIQIWDVVYGHKTVLVDEIDSVLNSLLGIKVIKYIRNTEHRGQFIFTTHNILHLNTNIFMKEQIYFVSKDVSNLDSELYSLAEFAYKYDNPNVYELYMKGLLGGIPND